MMHQADHSTIPGRAPRDPGISGRKTRMAGPSPAEGVLAGGTSPAMTE